MNHILNYFAQTCPVPLTDGLCVRKSSVTNADINTVLPYVFAVIGALSVMFIIIGGLKYILASGDPHRTEVAKFTVLYAVLGLIVSVSAFTIVQFVLGAAE